MPQTGALRWHPTFMGKGSDQTIIVRFVLNDEVLDERRYDDIDEVPGTVEINGEQYSTVGTDPEGRTAWHTRHAFGPDGTAIYRLTVVR
jgi:hypothetical protein